VEPYSVWDEAYKEHEIMKANNKNKNMIDVKKYIIFVRKLVNLNR